VNPLAKKTEGPRYLQNEVQRTWRMALKVGWRKTLPSRVFKIQVRLEKGKTRLNKSAYLELACFDSLCGAFFSNTSTRWRPFSGIETFPPSTISFAVIFRP
jgi:hypothetical protein